MARTDRTLDAAVACTRFGLGARPGEIATAASDPQGWLVAQIRPDGAQAYPGPTAQEIGGRMQTFRQGVKALQEEYGKTPKRLQIANATSPATPSTMMQPAMSAAPAGETTMQSAVQGAMPAAGAPPLNDFQLQRRALYMPMNQANQAEILARAQLGASTTAPFQERWALFWSNHFTVSGKNEETRVLAPVFEREAIRPHVFGRFETLLTASSTHPGMLAYLDQQQSVGPNSMQVQRVALRPGPQGPRRAGGLNENLAREIMELHTVGADGGYTQADVTEFARALTGFGIGVGAFGDGAVGTTVFREASHEPGVRTVMARRYDEAGMEQAHAILIDLANRPQTAHHLCTKIAAHFVSDTPDPKLVARLEGTWRRSGGDLGQVAQALITAPEAWRPQAQKLKTPYELVISSYRAVDRSPVNVQKEVMAPLSAFGQRPFEAPQPNGWSDEAVAWAAPDALVKRLTWAQGFAGAYAPASDPAAVAESALGARLNPPTLVSISRAESRPEAVALLIMSPEFQRR